MPIGLKKKGLTCREHRGQWERGVLDGIGVGLGNAKSIRWAWSQSPSEDEQPSSSRTWRLECGHDPSIPWRPRRAHGPYNMCGWSGWVDENKADRSMDPYARTYVCLSRGLKIPSQSILNRSDFHLRWILVMNPRLERMAALHSQAWSGRNKKQRGRKDTDSIDFRPSESKTSHLLSPIYPS